MGGLRNFGRNVEWRGELHRPADEAALRALLEKSADRPVRAMGARHSWSRAAATEGIALDLGAFDHVKMSMGTRVTVGAGCTLERLLHELRRHGRTLPTMGVILKQTVAGALSTGTHGSGTPCLSHYVKRVKLVQVGGDGHAKVVEFREADEDTRDAFDAARCGLGCAGVLVEVDLETLPCYLLEQVPRGYDTLEKVLERIERFPLTHFVYVPYADHYVSFERRHYDGELRLGDRIRAWWHRGRQRILVDRLSHWLVWVGARIRWFGKCLVAYTRTFAGLGSRWIDDDYQILTFAHDAVRHEEMEVFVPAPQLVEAMKVVRAAIEAAHRDGTFVMHYPVSLRRVAPDSTLISMASGGAHPGDWYTLSFFTYQGPASRGPYRAFCDGIAHQLARLGARPHWGKHFPLSTEEVEGLYPRLARFREVCGEMDPLRRFRNDFTARALGLP